LSLELRQRLETLLAAAESLSIPANLAGALRGVAILDQVGTEAARQKLDELSKGAADARLTREAQAARERLTRQSSDR
jgi:hypothetical protein